MFILDVQRNSILAGILKNQAVGNITGGKDGITKFLGQGVTTWLGSNSMGASIGGSGKLSTLFGIADKGTLSNGAALGIGAAGIGAGALMGIYHGKKMEEQGGSFARGLFLGTGYKGKEGGNFGSVAGNTAKYAAIGAGVGALIPVVGPLIGAGVGALTGLVTGVVGATQELKKNTTAVGKNTDTFKTTNDRIFKNSAMSEFFEGRGGTNDGFGMGGSDSSSGGYPWRVTSPFGTRDAIIDGKVIKGRKKMHYGVDFGVKKNTPIGAAMSGMDNNMKEQLDALEKCINIEKADFLNMKKDEIIPFIEEEIAVRYYYQEAGVRVRLRYDKQLKEALTKKLIEI